MRSFTAFVLTLPSLLSPLHAEDRAALDDKYRKLAVQMTCSKDCDQTSLKMRADGAEAGMAERMQSTCRMRCSDAFNRTSSIVPTKPNTTANIE